ncbi:MAG: hypothetical protein IKZ98_08825 [Clostridia bacterium]|nr:hypothetical protein [Clostridia bacterium]
MKKRVIALCLALVLILSIASTALAAHTHTYVFTGNVVTIRTTKTGSHVAGCHSCTYAHDHKIPVYTVYAVYKCSCGQTLYYWLDTFEGSEYCPYNPNT